ncbi:MAG: hypothetical protein J6Z82_03395 [Schwartzia sp.]|nr:hypothetical protein [Schwartzia sp. (in: firmicutes)]
MKDNKKILLALMLSCCAIFGYLMWQDYKEAPRREARIAREKELREEESQWKKQRAEEERQRNKQRREQQQKDEKQTSPSKGDKPKKQREAQVNVNDALKPPDGVEPMSIREIKANARSFQGKEVTVGPLFVDSNHLDRNVISAYIARSINLEKTFPVEYDSSEGLYIFYGNLLEEQRHQMIELSEKKVNIFYVQGVFNVDSIGTQGIMAQNVWIRGQYQKKK